MIKKFKETSSFEVESGRGKKSIFLKSVEGVVTALQEEASSAVQTFNTLRIPRSLSMSVMRVYTVLAYHALLFIQNCLYTEVPSC